MSSLAPVVLFVYRRPRHLERVLDALRANPEAKDTDLIVYSDGAKSSTDEAAVREVRKVLGALRGFHSVQVIERPQNLGLSASVVGGVSEVVARHGQVIVLEDDLVVSPAFLGFMNQGLERYRAEPNVASIHGYCYPVARRLPETFFLRGADCWGWATWARAWAVFEPDGQNLLAELRRRQLERQFDLDGTQGFMRMLGDQIVGRNDSWAIRWHASTFLRGMVTLYPGLSLVSNIGMDGSGTHSSTTKSFDATLAQQVPAFTTAAAVEDPVARAAVVEFFGRRAGLRSRLTLGLRAIWRAASRALSRRSS